MFLASLELEKDQLPLNVNCSLPKLAVKPRAAAAVRFGVRFGRKL